MGLGFMLYQSQNKLNETERILFALNAEKTLMTDKIDKTYLELEGIKHQFKSIQSDDFLRIKLIGSEKFPTAKLYVYWNKESQQTYIGMVNMPPLPAGKQYQLWALVAGKPINAGVFNFQSDSLFLSPVSTPSAETFAVTIENIGGSVSPTLSDLVVIGQVNS